jgi:DNA polymerase
MARDSLYLTNAVKHFKWNYAASAACTRLRQREILACHGWLEEEIRRVKPQVIVALGSTALKSGIAGWRGEHGAAARRRCSMRGAG